MYKLLERFLLSPRLPWILAAFALFLCLPALGLGLLADDYFHKALITGSPAMPPVENVALELFVFFDGTEDGYRALAERGLLPWWAPEIVRAAFLRPVAAVTHQLDYLLWPDSPALMHLHSLAWLGLVVVLASWLYRRLSSGPLVAGAAALLFALEDGHAASASWIANRNALMALAFVIAALLMHHRWRKQRWLAGSILAPLAFALAMLSGEAALGGAAYLLGYALWLDRGPLPRRLATLLPYGAVLVLWATAFKWMGYGSAGSDVYVDPTASPLAYAAAVVERIPVLMTAQWLNFSADLWIVLPVAGQRLWSLLGVVMLAGLLAALWPLLRRSDHARFWLTGMLVCLLPLCSAFPMDRLLLFASLGAAGLLAALVERAGWLGSPAGAGRLVRISVVILLVIHIPLSVLLTPVRVWGTGLTLGAFGNGEQHVTEDPGLADQQLVFVNCVEFMAFYVPLIRTFDGGVVPAGTDWMGHLLSDMRVTRSAPDSLTVRPVGGFLANRAEALVRSPSLPFNAGDTFERTAMTVTVDQVTDDGRPAVATFRFQVPLEDPSLRFVVWKNQELVPFEIPELGETVRVAPSLPPF